VGWVHFFLDSPSSVSSLSFDLLHLSFFSFQFFIYSLQQRRGLMRRQREDSLKATELVDCTGSSYGGGVGFFTAGRQRARLGSSSL
jgi:hypothetical protein